MKWTVKKGSHYFKPKRFRLHTGITLKVWEVEFNETNLYDPGFEDDWNKLCGWSYGLLPIYDKNILGKGWYPAHHENSLRIGWRPVSYLHLIELCIYAYENGERKVSGSMHVPLNTPVRLTLWTSGNKARLKKETNFDRASRIVEMQYNVKAKWGYYLNPFFGGTFPAYQNGYLKLTPLT